MKIKPMIFNTEMVKALLDGRKTVTRRPLNIPDGWELRDRKMSKITSSHPKKSKWGALILHDAGGDFPQGDIVVAPCYVGDLIYVRETFCHQPCANAPELTVYRAGYPQPDLVSRYESIMDEHDIKWTPSIHMPRKHSRLTLKVTDVRIERAQEITEEQAVAEGLPTTEECQRMAIKAGLDWYQKPHVWFKHMWERIYKNWHQNPYVWVIEFEVIHRNVDLVKKELEQQ